MGSRTWRGLVLESYGESWCIMAQDRSTAVVDTQTDRIMIITLAGLPSEKSLVGSLRKQEQMGEEGDLEGQALQWQLCNSCVTEWLHSLEPRGSTCGAEFHMVPGSMANSVVFQQLFFFNDTCLQSSLGVCAEKALYH